MTELGGSEAGNLKTEKIIEFPRERRPKNVRFGTPEDRGKVIHLQGASNPDINNSAKTVEFRVDDGPVYEGELPAVVVPPEFKLSPEEAEKFEKYKDSAKRPDKEAIRSVLDDLREEGHEIPDELMSFMPDWLNESWWGWEDFENRSLANKDNGRFPDPVGENVDLFQIELATNSLLQKILVGASIRDGLSSEGEQAAREVLTHLMLMWRVSEQKFDFEAIRGDTLAKARVATAQERIGGIKLVAEKGIPTLGLFMQRYYEMDPDKRLEISEKPFFPPAPKLALVK